MLDLGRVLSLLSLIHMYLFQLGLKMLNWGNFEQCLTNHLKKKNNVIKMKNYFWIFFFFFQNLPGKLEDNANLTRLETEDGPRGNKEFP